MHGSADLERAALVALLRVRPGQITWAEVADRVTEVGSAREVWRQGGSTTPTLFEPDEDPLREAAADIAGWERSGLRLLTFIDADFPAQLREIQEMPPVLFARGELVPGERGVSVVGSRVAPPDALEFARELAETLVASGMTVISGLATGVDTTAHLATLAAGGRTVAVIGTGIRRSYPRENASLQDRIASEGLLLSQFWPDAPPQRHTFVMRNAIMSGYGQATVVVAAGETSGARVQARMAVAHGRPVILTDRVVRATEWARALEGRPGVHVVSTVSEAMAVVADVTRPLPRQLEAILPAG